MVDYKEEVETLADEEEDVETIADEGQKVGTTADDELKHFHLHVCPETSTL